MSHVVPLNVHIYAPLMTAPGMLSLCFIKIWTSTMRRDSLFFPFFFLPVQDHIPLIEPHFPDWPYIFYRTDVDCNSQFPLLALNCYLIWCFSHRAAAYQHQFDILVILSRLMGGKKKPKKKKKQSNFSATGGVRIHLGCTGGAGKVNQ